ncbi:MAG: hypothetical protein IPO91_34360 [Chloroflexi bacterium]|nr:hypothetical protein [Chloroflexota bacterium]
MSNQQVVVGVVRLTPRFVWQMAGDASMLLNVGRLRFSMPRLVRAAAIWWMCRKQFPVRMVAVPVQTKAE